jgi:hypothetical protein
MNSQPDQLHRTQKIGFALLSLFGICVLVLGAYQFRTTIYGPFAFKPTSTDSDRVAIDQLFDEETRLQRIDTDGDGINDFDELYFYNTSPYLADTDSDGVTDYDEIFVRSTDPICPTGADCELFNDGSDATTLDETIGTSELLDGSADQVDTFLDAIGSAAILSETFTPTLPIDEETGLPATDTEINEQETIETLIQNPAAIRELLRQSGTLSEEQINAFSDELLIETAASLLNE